MVGLAKDNPVLLALTAFVVAVLGVLPLVGVHLAPGNDNKVVAVVVAAYVLAFVIRAKVTPNHKV